MFFGWFFSSFVFLLVFGAAASGLFGLALGCPLLQGLVRKAHSTSFGLSASRRHFFGAFFWLRQRGFTSKGFGKISGIGALSGSL